MAQQMNGRHQVPAGLMEQNSSMKVPPQWEPSMDRDYPFRLWQQDVMLWLAATDLDEHQTAAAIVLRLGGTARMLARELDLDVLINGQVQDLQDGQGAIHRQGAVLLLYALSRRFNILNQEQQIASISEFLSFRRKHGETIDEVLTRWELVRLRAQNLGQAAVTEAGLSWLVLSFLQLPASQWPLLLAPTNGRLPSIQAEYSAFLEYLRRHGHLYERQGDPSRNIRANFYVEPNQGERDSLTAYYDDHWPEHHRDSDQHEQGYSFPPPPLQGYFMGDHYAMGDNSMGDYGDELPLQDYLVDDYSESEDDEPDDVLFSDLAGLDQNLAGETIYLEYQYARKRWHRFSGFRRFGKGKGRKGKGKGKRPPFQPSASRGKGWFLADGADDASDVYFKGRSKGKSNSKQAASRTNPLGRDGQPLKCSTCGSIHHLRARCPKSGQSGQSASSSSTKGASSSGGTVFFSSPIPEAATTLACITMPTTPPAMQFTSVGPPPAPDWIPGERPEQRPWPRIEFADGTPPITLFTDEPITVNITKPSVQDLFTFVWWEIDAASKQQTVYHSRTRISGKEGLLVDIGAVDNVSGDMWVQRQADICARHGLKVKYTAMTTPLSLQGVGSGSSSCTTLAEVPVQFANGQAGSFKCPVISDSQVPALLGLRSLKAKRSVIDVFQRKLMCVGPGGYQLVLSPGSVVYDLEEAPSGHLLLPVSEWNVPPTGDQPVHAAKCTVWQATTL